MPERKHLHPPKWAERFLRWYCRPEIVEDLQGDLNEYFERHCRTLGPRKARLVYIIDVFKFFRGYTIRKPEFINLLIHWIMIGSYLKTSGRSIVRNKLFSGINIFGLAISMSIGLLMIAFLNDLFSYDEIHENKDRIYRVINTHVNIPENRTTRLASSSLGQGRVVKEEVKGVEEVTLLRRAFSGDAHLEKKVVPLGGLYADENFFKVFSFPMVAGDIRTALKSPYSIVLTESAAKKLFGDQEALGQSIKYYLHEDTSSYVVTGVMRDIPKLSHVQFESLVSFSTYEERDKTQEDFMRWDNIWSNYIYLVIPEATNIKDVQADLDRISAEQNKNLEHATIAMHLQPLSEVAIGPDLSNQIGPTMIITMIYIVLGLAFVVILSACFNYTNLSIARSLRRSREVGIRKVIGARKGHVLGQFIVEAVIISLLSLILSLALFVLIKPHFLSLAPELGKMVSLDLSPKLILIFVVFAIGVGVMAGLLPALFFSRVNALQVLKDATSMRVFRNVNMRKALIVVQYTFSLMFITATVIGYKQYKHALSFDLGFQTSNIVNVELQGNKPDVLEKLLTEIPEVEMLSRSQMITSVGNYWGTQLKSGDKRDSTIIFYNSINEHYLPLHNHKLIAGRNFTAKASGAEDEIIVNEKVLKRFRIGTPMDAIGEQVYVDNKPVQIVGVMKDFHYGKIDSEIPEVIFRYTNTNVGHLNLKITSKDWPATFSKLEAAWKKVDEIHPLKATFYDDQIEEAYSDFSAMVKIIGFMAFLAISIASLGLLGMVVFITETRVKEISIRKVLGASEGSLIYILSRGFLLLLLIAALIAIPSTYFFFEKVVLADFVYHAPVGFFEMTISVVIVMALALILIGSQTLKVARSNPAEVLKTE